MKQSSPVCLDDPIYVLDPKSSPMNELRSICRTGVQEEAFYVCDVDDLIFKWNQWQRLMPRIHPHYAVKCNDSQVPLLVLSALGAGFDCASKGEIDKVMGYGVDPSRIIFAHPAKPASHIRHAASVGINLTTFDNESELRKMRTLHPECKLVLRIRCDDENAKGSLGVKYGCDAEVEGPRLLKLAMELELDVVGVSFHVGWGCRQPSVFQKAIRLARGIFDIGEKMGFDMNLLDIGGGFPGNDSHMFSEFAKVINQAVEEVFPSPDVRVISEPGSYFVTSAFTLATNVHSKREIFSENREIIGVMYYINDGLYGSFFDKLQGETFRGQPLDPPSTRLVPSSVWGPTCDGIDKVEDDSPLPLLEIGSWLVYSNVGAYSLALAGTFNGFPVPTVHAVASHNAWSTLKDKYPVTESHFVPSIMNGTNVLVEAARRLSLSRRLSREDSIGSSSIAEWQKLVEKAIFPPDSCRRGSLIDQDKTPRSVF